jgi:hypothetical protein
VGKDLIILTQQEEINNLKQQIEEQALAMFNLKTGFELDEVIHGKPSIIKNIGASK